MNLWNEISPYLSAIVLIGGAGAIIWKWIKPAFTLTKKVDENEVRIKELEKGQRSDALALDEMRTSMKLQNRAMLSVVNHMIDGNGIEKLKESRNELQDMLMR